MSHTLGTPAAHLDAYPGIGFIVDSEDTLIASNAAARAAISTPAATFEELLDNASRLKWRALIAQPEAGTGELLLESAQPLLPRTFHISPLVDGVRLVLEIPRDPDADRAHDALSGLNSELVNAQREISKQKAQLQQTLESRRIALEEKERISLELQAHTEELEAQNEELLAMTEELRAQQEELTRLNKTLEQQGIELRRVMRSRERFFSTMSHELRTPLTAILGYDHLLLDGIAGDLTERQREFVERTRVAAQHLSSLIDDILDLAKLESGTLELSLEQTTLAALLADIVDTLRPTADAAGSEFRLDLDRAPPAVTTDVRALRQILLNLLSNALKFGGGRPVTVVCTRTGSDFQVDVADEGVGVADEEAERIFDEFTQGEAGRMQKGTGLGLAISRQLAERLGGRLELVPTDRGARFRVTLPIAGPAS